MSPLAKVLSFTLLLSSSCVGVSLSASNTGPVVELSYGSFQGNATGDLVEFLGMPFAAPPYASTQILLVDIILIDALLFLKSVGDLRFAPAEPPLKFTGVRQATSFGPACIQQAVNIPSIPGGGSATGSSINVTSEDCMDYCLKLRLCHNLTKYPS